MKQTTTALDAIDALTMKLRQAKAVATLVRTSGSNACLDSLTTAAGLIEDLLDEVKGSADDVYGHASAAAK